MVAADKRRLEDRAGRGRDLLRGGIHRRLLHQQPRADDRCGPHADRHRGAQPRAADAVDLDAAGDAAEKPSAICARKSSAHSSTAFFCGCWSRSSGSKPAHRLRTPETDFGAAGDGNRRGRSRGQCFLRVDDLRRRRRGRPRRDGGARGLHPRDFRSDRRRRRLHFGRADLFHRMVARPIRSSASSSARWCSTAHGA